MRCQGPLAAIVGAESLRESAGSILAAGDEDNYSVHDSHAQRNRVPSRTAVSAACLERFGVLIVERVQRIIQHVVVLSTPRTVPGVVC
jgi:hypothetical protein